MTRHKAVIRGICLLVIFLCLIVLFFVKQERIYPPHIDELFNFGHLLLFGILAAAVLFMLSPEQRMPRQKKYYLAAGSFSILFGLLSELIQLFMPWRSCSAGDWLYDCLGAVTCLVFLYFFPARSCAARKICMYLCVFVIAGASMPVFLSVRALRQAQARLPLICSFESMSDLSLWETRSSTATLSALHVTQGSTAVQIVFSPGSYPGIYSKYIPHDWEGYGIFAGDIFLEGLQPLRITINIIDRQHAGQWNHEAYYREFVLQPGWNHIKENIQNISYAPKTRRLDMRNILWVHIHANSPEYARTLFIDNIRLIR